MISLPTIKKEAEKRFSKRFRYNSKQIENSKLWGFCEKEITTAYQAGQQSKVEEIKKKFNKFQKNPEDLMPLSPEAEKDWEELKKFISTHQ